MGLLDVYLSASSKAEVPTSRWAKDAAAKTIPRVAAPFMYLPVLRAYIEVSCGQYCVRRLVFHRNVK